MQESQNIRIKKPKTQTLNFPVLINCIVLGKKALVWTAVAHTHLNKK